MRTIATTGDIYGPDAGSTFYNNNNNTVGLAGTANGSPASAGGTDGSGGDLSSINPVSVASNIQGTLLGNGVFQWCMIAVVLIGTYALVKKYVPNVESNLAVPRVSIPSWLSIGVQAFLFLVVVKTLLKKYNIPGLSGLAANA
jgi:hypothetical protein